MAVSTSVITNCYHCGTACEDKHYVLDDKQFCCAGCRSVYQILSENNLCNYYRYNDTPGQRTETQQRFDYLDEPSIVSRLVDYTDQDITVITFYIPSIHCSSCIWLLEHLHKLDSNVLHSRIDFLKKEVNITFRHQQLSLRKLVELLSTVGYEPLISQQDVVKEKKHSVNRVLIKRIALAGFCMGNVMLFTFPEYLGLSSFERQFQHLFGWLNLIFSIPVVFYSARDFFTSAYASLKNKIINLDTPLALIIAVLFLRTAFEVITRTGPGFADTLTGLVFLLLLGRWVRQRTYHHLSFERDYRSYFPVGVTLLKDGKEKPAAIDNIGIGDRMLIHNNEIVPADSILMKGEGWFDFSFVTGESAPVQKVLGEIVYAGGRQLGEAVEMEVVKPVSQSYLTRLWNNETFTSAGSKIRNFNDTIAQYFSYAVLVIAFGSALFWMLQGNSGKAWNAFTAVIIVACPCVIALSTPFTLSAVLSIFDKNRFYLKNTDVVEQLARVDTLVFDKTGTITSPQAAALTFSGHLTALQKELIASLARNSMHPLSREIIKWLKVDTFYTVSHYREIAGKGVSGTIKSHAVVMGNASFAGSGNMENADSSTVYVSIDNEFAGYFKIKQQWRSGLKEMINRLSRKYKFHVISGDNKTDRSALAEIFPAGTPLSFKQSPQDKLEYIQELQQKDKKVMMLGDGLNDAGALKQSDLGVAVTDNINNFSPGCDAILDGVSLSGLPQFIAQAKHSIRTIKKSFGIALIYNLVGIYFAVQGALSPLIAAVLMPLSTMTIITFTSITIHRFAKKNKLK